VENDWLQSPVGIGDAVCALLGEPAVLGEVSCEACTLAGSVRLPDDLTVLGIDCGTLHPDAKLKFERVRTATFMGRSLIDRIIRHEGLNHPQWGGHLSRISVSDYVERFRDRLPTKLRGSEYLNRFGETGDSLTRTDPDFVYKIRSRTEHHIYEHARASQFVECLSRAIRNDDERALLEAGEVMYASHWSYGQRCGLGSVETDLLVNLLRAQGGAAGIYGAKTTARGCGGVVAVLMRAGEKAAAAVQAAVSQYESKTGHQARVIRGSSAGALVEGVRRM
jgi:galactokinase